MRSVEVSWVTQRHPLFFDLTFIVCMFFEFPSEQDRNRGKRHLRLMSLQILNEKTIKAKKPTVSELNLSLSLCCIGLSCHLVFSVCLPGSFNDAIRQFSSKLFFLWSSARGKKRFLIDLHEQRTAAESIMNQSCYIL